MSILDQADNPRRLVAHDDDSDVRSCAYPYATVLDGIRWWVQRDRLSFPLHGVEDQSRPWGPCVTPASGERNYTSTGPKLSKTLRSRPLIPGCEAISRERIAALPCARLSRTRTPMPYLTAWWASEFRWALACLLSTLLHIPSRLSRVHSTGLKAECCRWRVSPCPFHALWLPNRSIG